MTPHVPGPWLRRTVDSLVRNAPSAAALTGDDPAARRAVLVELGIDRFGRDAALRAIDSLDVADAPGDRDRVREDGTQAGSVALAAALLAGR
ncbi:hypothetical protein [Streptomyces fradiae]|uniref:hypothetical protein n=1 Tax=Streptomyces fradiae TaxID=1906 RepID=UPI0039866205